MKKLLFLLAATISLNAYAQSETLTGCMGLKFGDTGAKVKQVMGTKQGFIPYKTEPDNISYTDGSFAGRKTVGAIFKLYQDQLHTIIILIDVDQEPKIMDLYHDIVSELESRYGIKFENRNRFRSPYFEGDGYTVSAVKLGYADISAAYIFGDDNAIAVEITPSMSIKITYQNTILVTRVIEAEQEKRNKDY